MLDVPRLAKKQILGSPDLRSVLTLLHRRLKSGRIEEIERAIECWRDARFKKVVEAGLTYIRATSKITKDEFVEILERKKMSDKQDFFVSSWDQSFEEG
ncbi:MAG: hypothetical protein NUW37_13585 [Planctomycetes bacterium]|nr:hypothetical protein [Planctomycetota bacterium]